MTPNGLMIALPAGGGMNTAHTTQSLYDLGQLLATEGVPSRLKWLAIADIPDARNLFLSLWYDLHKECSHLLMVDADMHFSPYLVWDMLCFGKPVTGVLYSQRNMEGNAVGMCLTGKETMDDVEKGHLKVKGVGGGVLLISRSAIDEMLRKFPDISDDPKKQQVSPILLKYGATQFIRAFDRLEREDGKGRLSEDLSFCERWRRCGGEVWANVHHPIGHVGHHDFVIRYEDFLQTQTKAEAA